MVLRRLKFLKSPGFTVDLPLPLLHIEGLARDWGWDQAGKPHPLLQHHRLVTVGPALVSVEDRWEEPSAIHHEAKDLQQL